MIFNSNQRLKFDRTASHAQQRWCHWDQRIITDCSQFQVHMIQTQCSEITCNLKSAKDLFNAGQFATIHSIIAVGCTELPNRIEPMRGLSQHAHCWRTNGLQKQVGLRNNVTRNTVDSTLNVKWMGRSIQISHNGYFPTLCEIFLWYTRTYLYCLVSSPCKYMVLYSL